LEWEIEQCMQSIKESDQGLFEYKDPTGTYCFAPSKYYCPGRYFMDGIDLEPAFCNKRNKK